jgi:hypothetical protein
MKMACRNGDEIIIIHRRRRLTKAIVTPADDGAVGFQGKTMKKACGNGYEIIPRRRRRLTNAIVPPADDFLPISRQSEYSLYGKTDKNRR